MHNDHLRFSSLIIILCLIWDVAVPTSPAGMSCPPLNLFEEEALANPMVNASHCMFDKPTATSEEIHEFESWTPSSPFIFPQAAMSFLTFTSGSGVLTAGFLNLWILLPAVAIVVGLFFVKWLPTFQSYQSAWAQSLQSGRLSQRKREKMGEEAKRLRRDLLLFGGIGLTIFGIGGVAAHIFAPDKGLEPLTLKDSEIPGVVRDAANETYLKIQSGEWMDPTAPRARELLRSLKDIADGNVPIQLNPKIGGLLHFNTDRQVMQVHPDLIRSIPRRDLPEILAHEATHRTLAQLKRVLEEMNLAAQINTASDILASPETIKALKRAISLVITDENEAYANQYEVLGNIARHRGISVRQYLQESADHSNGARARDLSTGLVATTTADGKFDAKEMSVRIAFGPYNMTENLRRALLILAIREKPELGQSEALRKATNGEQWDWTTIRSQSSVRQWVLEMVRSQAIPSLMPTTSATLPIQEMNPSDRRTLVAA